MVVMEVVGRDRLRLVPPSPCALLLAPHSTGKRTATLAAARASGVAAVDTVLVPAPYWVTPDGRRVDPAEVDPGVVLSLVEPELSVADVRDLQAWARTAPRSAAGRLAVVRLGHRTDRVSPTHPRSSEWVATRRVQSMMLKLLEEPPPGVRLVLTAATGVLPTISSRSVVSTAGLLSVSDLALILDRVSDLPSDRCLSVAALAGGQVRPALTLAAGSSDVELVRVRAVLTALARRDHETVAGAASGWTGEATALLGVWARECYTGVWRVFESADAVLPRPAAWRLLQLLSTWSGTRPRLLLASLSSALDAS